MESNYKFLIEECSRSSLNKASSFSPIKAQEQNSICLERGSFLHPQGLEDHQYGPVKRQPEQSLLLRAHREIINQANNADVKQLSFSLSHLKCEETLMDAIMSSSSPSENSSSSS